MSSEKETAKDLQSTAEKVTVKDDANAGASAEVSTSAEISTSAEVSASAEVSVPAVVSASAGASGEGQSSSNEYIRLRVITGDMTNEVHFRVKPGSALGRLKRSYCNKLGFVVEELRFMFDGYRFTDEDTPDSLGMVNEDVIEIYQERTGGK